MSMNMRTANMKNSEACRDGMRVRMYIFRQMMTFLVLNEYRVTSVLDLVDFVVCSTVSIFCLYSCKFGRTGRAAGQHGRKAKSKSPRSKVHLSPCTDECKFPSKSHEREVGLSICCKKVQAISTTSNLIVESLGLGDDDDDDITERHREQPRRLHH